MLSLPRLILPVALAATSLAIAAPASADVTGTTSTQDVVLLDHCQRHPISYDLAVSPGTLLWRLEVQVADPLGRTSEGTVINSSTNPTTSGTVEVTFCGSEPAGTYTVRATGFYELLPVVQLPFALPETSFEVRPAATRTTLSTTSLGHGRYLLTAKVRKETERGFGRANGVQVRLERLVSGTWKRVRGLALTATHGRAVARVDGRPGQRLRAVVTARNNVAGSTSAPVRLR
ncbi:hypothetical protein [Nocardioides halotolerans]|uniref:hypothetical protein n=1 Tax=Nocardioides halotolerans TaxID=433660 RepID=UPI000420FC1C|nr:hypothetical protein [Nocardioides halotolerans]